MTETAQTAAEAYERYMAFLASDSIVQGSWHAEKDGRQLACALGVIGPEIDSPSDCPAQIMPRWLAQMVPWFFDNQSETDAKDWGSRFYAELKRLDGAVPFSVVHDWQANTVSPLAIEVATMRKRDIAPHEAVRDLHIRALAGDLAPRDEWFQKLKHAYAYANANAYECPHADAGAIRHRDRAATHVDPHLHRGAYGNRAANGHTNPCPDRHQHHPADSDGAGFRHCGHYGHRDADRRFAPARPGFHLQHFIAWL